jgi:hypothetical protein
MHRGDVSEHGRRQDMRDCIEGAKTVPSNLHKPVHV